MKIKKKIFLKSEHGVPRENISRNALKVLDRLNEAGYQAYLVGGGVRDLLLGKQPKDFDVATNAHPEDVKHLFRNCRLIGRRFRLAHILYGRDVIEVATFRGPHEGEKNHRADQNKQGRIIRDNVYGSLEEDAIRRDFSINALYYNVQDESIIDFTGGMQDLKKQILRMIGDVELRYHEDPVRMLRAVRFAAKLDFAMDAQTHKLIFELGSLLEDIPVARLFDESIKLFQGGYGLSCFKLLRKYQLFELLFPMSEMAIQKKVLFPNQFEPELKHERQFVLKQELIQNSINVSALDLIEQALANTDNRIAQGKSVNPAFFLAVLLWHPMQQYHQHFIYQGQHDIEALLNASKEVIIRQQAHTSIPKRLSLIMREIWHMQPQLQHPTRKRALRTLQNKRFRAAYDFLLLRQSVGELNLTQWCDWWTEIQTKPPSEQELQCSSLGHTNNKRRARKRYRKNK